MTDTILRTIVSSLTLAIFAMLAAPASAELSVDEIVDKTNHVAYCQGDNGRANVKMTIVDGQKNKRERKLSILRWDDQQGKSDKEAKCDKQRYYVYFHRPADVNKMSFLVWKNPGKEDDRWLYLPALDLVKRISSADKRTSFVGSNFFYEDVSGRAPTEDHHKLVKTTKDYYVLDNIPKSKKSVEFSRYRMWIHKESFVIVKVEYYDNNGKAYRRYDAKQIKDIDGYKTVTRARMSDLRSGGYTDLKYSGIKYNVGVGKSVFTERSLRKAPRKHLR